MIVTPFAFWSLSPVVVNSFSFWPSRPSAAVVDVAGCLQFALVKNCRGNLAAPPQDGEFNDLTANCVELAFRGGIDAVAFFVEEPDRRIERDAERRWPASKRARSQIFGIVRRIEAIKPATAAAPKDNHFIGLAGSISRKLVRRRC